MIILKKKLKTKTLGIVCLILCLLCVTAVSVNLAFGHKFAGNALPDLDEYIIEETPALEEEIYESPIDFDSLNEDYPDIYAWIKIPETNIDYPIAQHELNDGFYINHDIDGKKNANGTLFTERAHNSRDFTDRVTFIYGHNMRSGAMFGTLRRFYTNTDNFKNHKEIIVYLPKRELHYSIFAAVPYSDAHVMYYNKNFKDSAKLENFIEEIYSSRDFGINLDYENVPTKDDTIIVLSTCLSGNDSKRYFVLAKLDQVIE